MIMQRVTDDDFDENGVLKDGHRMRVPMMMMDARRDTTSARTRIVDAFGNGGAALHRPGARYAAPSPHTLDAAEQATLRHMRDEAYANYERDISERWKGPSR
jgi:hypothetical protein